MATDQEKIAHQAQMLGLIAFGLTIGIWEMVEESATSLTP